MLLYVSILVAMLRCDMCCSFPKILILKDVSVFYL